MNIERHSAIDKSFEMNSKYINFNVDYDDVNHIEVDTAAEIISELVDKYWDEKEFRKRLQLKAIEVWNKNEWNLQSDYESFDEYMECFRK